jgi:hypothetical protein
MSEGLADGIPTSAGFILSKGMLHRKMENGMISRSAEVSGYRLPSFSRMPTRPSFSRFMPGLLSEDVSTNFSRDLVNALGEEHHRITEHLHDDFPAHSH